MSEYLKLLEKGAGAVGLDDELELVEALAALAKDWRELARKIVGAESLDALLDKVATDIGGTQVKQAFTDLHLEKAHATLARLLNKLTEGLAKIPDKYKKLFEPLSKYEAAGGGLVEWKLDVDKDAEIGKDVKLGVKAGAALQLDAAAKPKIDGTEMGPLLRIGVAANVKANASGKFPIRFGTVGAAAEASVEVGLDYYFDPTESSSLYAVAVAQRILALPDPFSYDGVWEAFQARPDLGAIVYSFADKASANVDVALSATGSLVDNILADVKLTIGAKASVDNKFTLSLRAEKPAAGQTVRRIAIVLGRTSASEVGLSVGLDVGIDFSAPLGRVREILDRAVARSDELLAQVTPFLSPGTWLRGEFKKLVEDGAKSLIADAELREALVKDMQSLGSAGTPDDPAILTWLTGKITGAIDGAAKEFTDQGEGARDRLIGKIANALPEPLKGPFRQKATVAIGPLADKAAEALTKKLDDLIKVPNKAFGKALNKIGAAASDKVDKIDKAFEGIRKLIDRYNDLLHQAQAFANDAARAKVTASLKIEELWNWGLEEKIVGTFTASTPEARDLFRQISRGELASLRELILGGAGGPGSAIPGFELNRTRSSLKRSAGRTSKADFELVLFGFSLSASTLLSGDAKILIDGDGQIQVDAKGELKKRFKSDGETREATFVDSFSLRLAKTAQGTPLAERSIEVGIGLSYIDEKLELSELKAHVASLAKAGLVTTDTGPAAEAQFGIWSPNGKAIAANLAAKFELSHAQVKTLMFLDKRPGGQLDLATKKKLIDTMVEAAKKLGPNRANVKIGKEKVEDSHSIPSKPLNEFLFDRLREKWDYEEDYPERNPSVDIVAIISEYQRAQSLVAIVQRLGDIYTAEPKIGSASGANAWSERKYADEEHRLAQDCGKWLAAGGRSGDVPATTVTFLATICDLLAIPRSSGGAPAAEGVDALALTFSRRKADDSIAEEVPLTQTARGALTG